MAKIQEIREEQSNFLRNYLSPRPLEFFKRFKFRSKPSAYNNYKLGLEQALRDEPNSEKLLEIKRKYDNNDFADDWSLYDDWRKNKKINEKVKKRKRKAHAIFHAQLDDDLDGGEKRTEENLVSNTDNKENEEGSSNNNINREEVGGEDVDDSKIFVCDILKDVISSSRAEKDVLDIYISNFSHSSFMDLRPRSEFSLSLDQNLQDQILHEVFDEIDDNYVTDEIHNYLTDFFNADHGHQGWCEAVRSIVICDEDSELLKDTKLMLKETLGRFVKAFSLDSLNPLRDVTTLERPHLNQFVHPLIDCSLWIFAKINYLSGEMPLQGKIRTNADGVGFLNDVSNYQIVCMEGAKPGARNKKIDDDDKKNIRNMAQLFNNIIVSEATERRQLYTGLRTYGATAYKTEVSLTMMDFRGVYRLFEVERFSLPKDWIDIPNFVFMYEALIKWALCICHTRDGLISQRKKRRMGRDSEARVVKKLTALK